MRGLHPEAPPAAGVSTLECETCVRGRTSALRATWKLLGDCTRVFSDPACAASRSHLSVNRMFQNLYLCEASFLVGEAAWGAVRERVSSA